MTLKGSVFSYGFALLRFVFKSFVEIQELLGAEFFGADGRWPIQKFNGRLDFLLSFAPGKEPAAGLWEP